MRIADAKKQIAHRLAQGFALPNDDVLAGLIHEAYVYIGMRCEPEALMETGATGVRVLRNLDRGYYLVVPDFPDMTDEQAHLQMDEGLSYAVVNHVCFLHSGEARFMMARDEIIMRHQQSVYQTYGELGDEY